MLIQDVCTKCCPVFLSGFASQRNPNQAEEPCSGQSGQPRKPIESDPHPLRSGAFGWLFGRCVQLEQPLRPNQPQQLQVRVGAPVVMLANGMETSRAILRSVTIVVAIIVRYLRHYSIQIQGAWISNEACTSQRDYLNGERVVARYVGNCVVSAIV